jgi:hypothetical protein
MFNQRANSAQANPNKTKQKSLDFLGFIRPNRDFSKGYEQKNKKNRLASQVVCKTSHASMRSLSQAFSPYLPQRGLVRRLGKDITPISEIVKQMSAAARSARPQTSCGCVSRRRGNARSDDRLQPRL